MSDDLSREQELNRQVREMPLEDRLKKCRQIIGALCSEGRAPKMSIPVQSSDEDWFVSTTAQDAVSEIHAIRAQLAEQTQRAEKTERILSAAGIPQSIQDVRNAWSALTERDEQIASLTAKLAEKEKDQHYINISYLQQQLAAMTQERDNVEREANRRLAERSDRLNAVQVQLDASEQRVREYHLACSSVGQPGVLSWKDYTHSLRRDIDQLQATVTAQAEEMGRLRGHLTVRRQEIEACIAAEVIAGNFWKEKIERAALVEIALMEKALASGKEAILSGKLESERDQLQATVTAQGEEIGRLTACITAQGAQMLAYHDTLKQVLAGGKEGA